MAKIETIRLRCVNPDGQVAYYRDVLGMDVLAADTVGYGGAEAALKFLPAKEPYRPQTNDLYWKIALAVPDIKLACQQLTDRGISVGTPRQFRDVGYLAHFQDPEGFPIELIAHAFEGQGQSEPVDPDRLGGGAHLNLLTLRAAEIAPIREACTAWKMMPLSVQPVESHGFTLYFFAFTSEQPPSKHLTAIENRTWVYQRPYTVLEVQHVHDADQVRATSGTQSGYEATEISNGPEDFTGAERVKFVRA